MKTPYSLKYVSLDDEPQGGSVSLWRIKINEYYKEDEGLLAHEVFHVLQFWCGVMSGLLASLLAWSFFDLHWSWLVFNSMYGFGLHGLLYTFIPQYRLWSEVQAYKIQLKYSPDDLDHFVEYIVENYNLNVSSDKVRSLLMRV